jgi:hypothetical protein
VGHFIVFAPTHNHFVFSCNICNVVDTYVTLKYKHHGNMATNVRFWVDANLNKVLYFQ